MNYQRHRKNIELNEVSRERVQRRNIEITEQEEFVAKTEKKTTQPGKELDLQSFKVPSFLVNFTMP